MITDATCTPVHIRFPQDTPLLNSARTNLEDDLVVMVHQLQIAPPRTYKGEAHAVWTTFSRKPRRWGKLTRKQIKAQLQYTHRIENRIMSLNQPEIQLIVRGKVKAPVEFSPKIDVSIMDGLIDIERFSFLIQRLQ